MEMKSVKSSQVHSIGYDSATKTLAVKFKGSGATYHYHDVPSAAHTAFVSAKSLGKHFHSHVRGKFKHKRQDEKK